MLHEVASTDMFRGGGGVGVGVGLGLGLLVSSPW